MSFSHSPYLIKLQDLKLWQNNYDNLLKTKSDATHPSDFDTIEGLSALDSPDLTPQTSPRRASVDRDKKVLIPLKPFDQLLEEKLTEEQPADVQVKVKKPFLRKGSGLLRYNLGPRPPLGRQIKRLSSSVLSEEKIKGSSEISLQNNEGDDEESQQKLTPLKVPDISIKSKPTWIKVGGEGSYRKCVDVESNAEHENESTGFHSNIIGKINEIALKHFLPAGPKKYAVSSDPNCISQSKVICDRRKDYDSLNTTEKELKIFEALEERAENTSFSSTNSSVMRLLSSTPNKKINPQQSPIIEEQPRDCEFLENRRLAQELKEVNQKSDMLSNFLHNLRKISKDNYNEKSGKENRVFSSDTSFSGEEEEEDEKSSTGTRNQSPSSFYTDFETTLRSTAKVDAAVNTSDLEKQKFSGCLKCGELRDSLEELKKKVPDIQAEKARVCDFAKDLEKKRDQLSKDLEKLRKKYDTDIGDLQEELESEKKKFDREKSLFDMLTKDSRSRPPKPQRDEISTLKSELAEARELQKLRDAKNGAALARLRNHVRQLERERVELRAAADQLRKENARLTAAQQQQQQRGRRSAGESRLLLEINRNVSRLAGEGGGGEKGGGVVGEGERGRRRRSAGDAGSSPTLGRKPLPIMKQRPPENRQPVTERIVDDVESSVEKQYETTFGQVIEVAPQINMNESKEGTKTTKIFPDGSKEIKYSNGSWKTISPDGQLIIFKYYNGDIKETNMKEGTVKYYFAESCTWNTEFPDGSELLEYANGQKEKKHKDGKIEVICPDGRLLTRMPDGSDEISYPDGSKILQNTDGEKIVVFPNGQKEFHTKDHKRREYPDGTVKFIYPDGTRETRYSSGRVRIKDSNNVLILDSHAS